VKAPGLGSGPSDHVISESLWWFNFFKAGSPSAAVILSQKIKTLTITVYDRNSKVVSRSVIALKLDNLPYKYRELLGQNIHI
jgi:hypothetical protein